MALEIENLRAIEYEALCQKHQVAQEQRIEQLGKIAQRISAELSKRDFSELPTDKLVDLLLKISKDVRPDIHGVSFKRKGWMPTLDLESISSWTG